jgi:hypothetical protein
MNAIRLFARDRLDLLWTLFPLAILCSISLGEAWAGVLVLVALVAGRWRRIPRNLLVPMLVFYAWIIVGGLLAGAGVADFRDAAAKWSFSLLLLLALSAGPTDGRVLRRSLILVAVAGILLVVLIRDPVYGRARAFSGGAPNLGTNLMMASLLFLSILISGRSRKPASAVVCLLLSLAGMLASLNRSAMLGLASGAAILVGRKRPLLVLLAVGGIAGLVTGFPDGSLSRRITSIVDSRSQSGRERVFMWKAGVHMLRDRPLLGLTGRRAFIKEYSTRYRDPNSFETTPGHVHNSYLQTAILHGIPGLGLLLWWLYVLFLRAVRLMRHPPHRQDPHTTALQAALPALIIAVLVNGFFDYVIADGQRAMMFYTLSGLILSSAIPSTRRSR